MAETDKFLQLLDSEKPNILAMLPQLNDWLTPDRWWSVAWEVARSKDLTRIAQNNPNSLINALKKVASWGLDLDGEECLIIPYGEEAVAQRMYKGDIRRAIEGGAVAHIVADLVRDGDIVKLSSGTSGRLLNHEPVFGNKGKVIGAYALITLPNGMTDYELFYADDIEAVKAAALRMSNRRKKPGEESGPSPAWRFFEGEMIKKSVIRRALKRFRGKRDTQAGELYNRIQREEPDAFDIDKVKAAQAANDDIKDPPPRKAENVEVVKDKSDAGEPISADEEALITAAAGKKNLRHSAMIKLINRAGIDIEDLEALKKGQVAQVLKVIQEFA